MRKLFYLLFFALWAFPCLIYGQGFKVTGTVQDSNGDPLIGVAVHSSQKTGTITDTNGSYAIIVNTGDILTFSYIGMTSRKVTVESEKVINITLIDQYVSLDEVVVIGYGTMKKRDLSGAIDQIKGDDLLRGNPASSINQALQGRLAGVAVNQSDGSPGGGVSIQIRGINSFSTDTQPLYVVDGIPFDVLSMPSDSRINQGSEQSSNPLSSINPHDIESIEVLKDASATAIYGSRGANGVILITTKKGVKGKDKIELTTNFSLSSLTKQIDMLDASSYAYYINETIMNSNYYEGKDILAVYRGRWGYRYDENNQQITSSGGYNPSPEDFKSPGIRTDQYGNETLISNTNWQDYIFKLGATQEYNLNVSGANDNGWHSISGNYINQEGIIIGSGFKRYALRSNLGRRLSKHFEIGMNLSYTNTLTDFARTNAHEYSIVRSALSFMPTYAPDMPASESDEWAWLAVNPVMYLNDSKDQTRGNQVSSSSYLEVKFTNDLKFRQNIGLGYVNNSRQTYYGRHTGPGKAPTNGIAGQVDRWSQRITAESLLTYNKTLKANHSLNLVGGFTYEQADYGGKSMSANNFPTDITGANDMSQGLFPSTLRSSKGQTKLVSFLGRANYSYKGKYIVTGSFRRDGSSKFVEGNKFADFSSAAVAWRLSEEPFIKNLNAFSNLKIRMSYGQTGNQGISAYQTMAYLSSSKYPFGGNTTSGFAENTSRGALNPTLRWETTEQYDLGLDASLMDNKINLTIDYYWKKTYDLLQNLKIPSSTGFTTMWSNSGSIINEGLELSGKFSILSMKDFKWNLNANISFNRNEIGGLNGDQYATRLWDKADNIFIQRNGFPIGAIYGYVEDGFYDNEAEVRADPIYTNESAEIVKRAIGDIKYRDLDGLPGITETDRTIIGDVNPDYIFGITNEFEWKNLTFNFFVQGVVGNDIFNGNLLNVTMSSRGNIPSSAYLSRWTPENTANAKWPKPIASFYREWKISDRYIEDGSYLKLKNVNVGYNFKRPAKGVENIHVYAGATNLITFTKYSWYDPDVNAFGGDASRRGVDNYSYPSSRTYSLGIKMSF